MLDRIEITNFATIEHMAFDLGSSLNIIPLYVLKAAGIP